LGNQSTVPFVRLQGSGGTQKEFTWGETVEVMPGQNVQVESASYMPGDIQIQSGKDTQNRPARTTIPIQVIGETPEGETLGSITPVHPCDCRGAKRAYLCILFRTSDDGDFGGTLLRLYGINKQHSWPGEVSSYWSGLEPTGKKYYEERSLASGVYYSMLGLGLGSDFTPSDYPMILADFVLWKLETDVIGGYNINFFYTLEYL
jgi:hypothetical protein